MHSSLLVYDCPMYGRLTGSARFERVLRKGARCRRGGITLIGMERSGMPTRVGLIVGRRVGSAVKRNRVRRRIRAVLREIRLSDGVDYVVIGTSAVARVPFHVLRRWLEEASAMIGPERERT